ncbi:MAG: hypothetical protein EOM05_10460, partial [Clostridia bacterium]|nr:hypothetical protein [Clostridia bacterium]
MSFKENLCSFIDAVALDVKLIWSAINNKHDLGESESSAFRGDRGKIAYDHSQQEHAPANSQKNSDITKEEIESRLIGTISTHDHGPQVVYATQEEVDLGENESKVVTPKTLVKHIGIDAGININDYVDTLITQTGAEPDANIVYAKNFPSNITVIEVQALDGITGNIQAQIDGIDIPELTKGAVESALTGEINSHSHAIPTHDHTTSTATWTAAQT